MRQRLVTFVVAGVSAGILVSGAATAQPKNISEGLGRDYLAHG